MSQTKLKVIVQKWKKKRKHYLYNASVDYALYKTILHYSWLYIKEQLYLCSDGLNYTIKK